MAVYTSVGSGWLCTHVCRIIVAVSAFFIGSEWLCTHLIGSLIKSHNSKVPFPTTWLKYVGKSVELSFSSTLEVISTRTLN